MASGNSLDAVIHADDFLKNRVYSEYAFSASGKLQGPEPLVTLTYAQSLDAKIAGVKGKQIQLSGPESAVMTHRLRAMHSHILVGVGTLLNDNPQLNCRLPSLLPVEQQPIPCILDSDLRTPVDCKLIQNAQKGTGHWPIIIANELAAENGQTGRDNFEDRRNALTKAGCDVRLVKVTDDIGSHKLPLSSIVRAVNGASLMIEGGAGVISSILSSSDGELPHRLIVTVAPKYVGNDGVSADITKSQATGDLQHITSEQFGRDTVVVCGLATT